MSEEDYDLLLGTLSLWKQKLVRVDALTRFNNRELESVTVMGNGEVVESNEPFKLLTAREAVERKESTVAEFKERIDTTISNGRHWTPPAGGSGFLKVGRQEPVALQPAPEAPIRTRIFALVPTPKGDITAKRVADVLGIKKDFNVNEALGTLAGRMKRLKRISVGVYRNLDDLPDAPAQVPAPTAAQTETAVRVEKLSAKAETECAKTVRRAIALMTTDTFTREDLTGKMAGMVGDRTLTGWNSSGGLSGALLDLRSLDMLELHPSSKPGLAVYTVGKHFVAVAA